MAKKWVRTPILGRFWIFLALGKRRMFPRTPLAVVQDSICAVVSPPRALHTGEKTSDRKQLDSGGWDCRIGRAYFLMKLASRPLKTRKISAARAETGVLCTPGSFSLPRSNQPQGDLQL